MGAEQYPCLGFEPARGNVETLHTLAGELALVSQYAGEAHAALIGIRDRGEVWTGEAAQTFGEHVEDIPGYLDDAHTSMDLASKALNEWSNLLAGHQQRARDLEEQARQAIQSAEQADARAQQANATANQPVMFDSNDPAAAQAAQRQADATAATANDAHRAAEQAWAVVEDIKRQAEQLKETWEADSAACADKLREAGERAPDEGMFESIGEALEGSLETIGDIAGIVSAIAGVLAFVPGVNIVAGPVALAAGAVALGAHAADMTVNGKWDDPNALIGLGGDVLGIIPGVGAIAKGAKGADEVVDAASAGAKLFSSEAGDLATTGIKGAANRITADGFSASATAEWAAGKLPVMTDDGAKLAAKTYEGAVDTVLQVPAVNGLVDDSESAKSMKDGFGAASAGKEGAVMFADSLVKGLR